MYFTSPFDLRVNSHFSPVRKLGEDLAEGLVPVAGDVLLDPQRIDHAAVAQHDLDLLLKEVDLVQAGNGLPFGGLVDQPLDHAALEQVLLDDLGRVVRPQALVEHAVRVDGGDGPDGARPQAAGFDDLDFAV
jgi:hypothetical protein